MPLFAAYHASTVQAAAKSGKAISPMASTQSQPHISHMADRLEDLRTALADRYEIEREIGAGGMATVSRPSVATDPPHSDPIGEKHG